jgi:hypothetical protein
VTKRSDGKHLPLDEVAEHVYNVYKYCQVMRSLFNTPVLTTLSEESSRVASDGSVFAQVSIFVGVSNEPCAFHLHFKESKKSEGTTYGLFETSGHSVRSQTTRKRSGENHKNFISGLPTIWTPVEKRTPNTGNVKTSY